MEHTRLLSTSDNLSTLYVEYDDSLEVTYKKYKILNDGTFESIAIEDITFNEIFWLSNVAIPDEDCYLIVVVYRDNQIIDYIVNRVGEPSLKVFYTNSSDIDTTVNTYFQHSKAGELLDSGSLVYLTDGISYFEPTSEFETFIKINSASSVLKLPYIIIPVVESNIEGIGADENFINTGYNTFGFLGERNSYFDLTQGKWINDEAVEVKAEDIAKAICSKYNLIWDDRNSSLWIGNYVKYIRTYEENEKKFRLYVPFLTPSTNDANYNLFQEDEADNLYLRGISILLLQSLETVNATDGARIPLRSI